ncbi:MAG TPA: tRNA-binding protein [Flavobacterium sp.]|nr:tRNA-binding protein [Flavobacterium sp.]
MNDSVTIDWHDFEKIEMRVGTVLEAQPFPEARKPALKLRIDFGPFGIRKTSAQITTFYTPETLVGKQVVAVLNFPPKQIGPFISECLVLGAVAPDGVTLLQPGQPVANGLRIA